MAKERVLIAVKTYPTLSEKYIELVCTAGFREDGSWIRIYPLPFRSLNEASKYKKYQWIELELHKNKKDRRPESYNPANRDDIGLLNEMSTGKNRDWAERKSFILQKNIIHTNLKSIIDSAHNNELSLAIFKPQNILDFKIEKVTSEWKASREQVAKAAINQGSLFDTATDQDYKLMPKLPYKFSYKFEDDTGKESTLMIEDWEIGQLYWNMEKIHGEQGAIEKVKEKYLNEFAFTKDLYLFLGTTYEHHNKKAPNPFVIIGTFQPPIKKQLSLL